MCRIKFGEQIKNKQDITNLVTAIILRQKEGFSINSILNKTEYYMKNSLYEINSNHLKELIICDIDVMSRNDEVYCDMGTYFPYGITEMYEDL